MPGPTRLPENVRVLRGARNPTYALPERVTLPPLQRVPAHPAWVVGDEAVAEFKRLAKVMIGNGTLNEGNTGLLGHYVMLHASAVAGWTNMTAAVGEAVVPRLPPASLVRELRLLGGALGIARVNFGAGGPPKLDNPFAEHAR